MLRPHVFSIQVFTLICRQDYMLGKLLTLVFILSSLLPVNGFSMNPLRFCVGFFDKLGRQLAGQPYYKGRPKGTLITELHGQNTENSSHILSEKMHTAVGTGEHYGPKGFKYNSGPHLILNWGKNSIELRIPKSSFNSQTGLLLLKEVPGIETRFDVYSRETRKEHIFEISLHRLYQEGNPATIDAVMKDGHGSLIKAIRRLEEN